MTHTVYRVPNPPPPEATAVGLQADDWLVETPEGLVLWRDVREPEAIRATYPKLERVSGLPPWFLR